MKLCAATFLSVIFSPCDGLLTPRSSGVRPQKRTVAIALQKSENRHAPVSPMQMSALGESVSSSSITSPTSISSTKPSGQPFDSFDYTAHWYPVCWAQDVPLNQPIRVTLLDVDYVLAKTTQTTEGKDEEVFYAMIDSCPHKKVALSEGRITDCGTSNKKYIQCSYHGWTFDGKDGTCVEIPQTVIAKRSHPSNDNSVKKDKPFPKKREDATAVAVTQVQGMLWIQPFLTPLEALAAAEWGTIFPPPRIPEMDLPGYKATMAVRDFPIDWTVLMENIMDPDHGLFAHSSSSMANGFDLYTADGAENIMQIDEEFMGLPNGSANSREGWQITSTVNAVEKLNKLNREVRIGSANGDSIGKVNSTENNSASKQATITFVAPSLIHMGRRDNSTSPSPFITGFWVCPVGTGRSRFMSAAISKSPIQVPRWLIHLSLNNFLDQDTFLLCGQHRAVLKKEAEGLLELESSSNWIDEGKQINNVRKSTYVYRSPSERLGMRVGQFFDGTLPRVPNRRESLLAWYNRNSYGKSGSKNEKDGNTFFQPWPVREDVLDRYEQHTKICPDSMAVVNNCKKIMKTSKVVGLALIFIKMLLRPPVTAHNPIPAGITTAFSSSASRIAAYFTQGKRFYFMLSLAFFLHQIANRFRKEFFFKVDEQLHRKDVKFISKKWMDL